jgi:pimeloyl-ACP methyl ester carboxylesterase
MKASSAAPTSPRDRLLNTKWIVSMSACRKNSSFDQRGARLCGALRGEVLAPGNRLHAERFADPRNFAADPAKAQNAQRSSGLSHSKQEALWATHAPPAADIFTQKVEGTAWKTKPSWYVVVKDDRIAQPALQHFAAGRMGVVTYETTGGHISMLSNPDLVLKVIREAADACSRETVG